MKRERLGGRGRRCMNNSREARKRREGSGSTGRWFVMMVQGRASTRVRCRGQSLVRLRGPLNAVLSSPDFRCQHGRICSKGHPCSAMRLRTIRGRGTREESRQEAEDQFGR